MYTPRSPPHSTTSPTIDERMRELIIAAMHKIAAEPTFEADKCIFLLSGGVDSSVVGQLAYILLGVRHAVSVCVAEPSQGTDFPWTEVNAASLSDLKHTILRPTLEELLDKVMPFTVQTLRSFDGMALRNSVCAAAALQYAASQGFTTALTGDAADEVLGGYAFVRHYDDEKWLEHRHSMVTLMKFDSVPLGQALGITSKSPYWDSDFIEYAMTLTKADCIGMHPLQAQPDEGKVLTLTGKLPLRQAFPESPSSCRRKVPAEIGCGTTTLGAAPWNNRPRGYFDTRIADDEYNEAVAFIQSKHAIKIRDKEHLAYFRIFEGIFGRSKKEEEKEEEETEGKVDLTLLEVPGKPRPNDDPCPACLFRLSHPKQTFCHTCGHYDVNLVSRHDNK